MESSEIQIDAKTRQNLQDIDRAVNELQTRKILILQTVSNIGGMKEPVVVGQYDCLREKEVVEDEQGQKQKAEGHK